MPSRDELLHRIRDLEDSLIERRPAGVNNRELRRTLTAFANAVPHGRYAVLYIGVRDDGSPQGVENPESVQQNVRLVCEGECYPAVRFSSEILMVDGKAVVAVVIPFNDNRPYFAGRAYIRKGSSSVDASDDMFTMLVAQRLTKCRPILEHLGQLITVVVRGKQLGSTKPLGDKYYRATHDCRIVACEPHFVRLYDITTHSYSSEPMENVRVMWDEDKNRLLLLIEEA